MSQKWTTRPIYLSHSSYRGDQNAPVSLKNGAEIKNYEIKAI